MEKQEAQGKLLKQRITRRDAIKAGGIAALGLAFSKPVIETIYPRRASASLSPVGKCAVVNFRHAGTITGETRVGIPIIKSETYISLNPDFECSECGGLKCISEDRVENWRFVDSDGNTVSPQGVTLSNPFGTQGEQVDMLYDLDALEGILHLTSDRVVTCFKENCEPDTKRLTSLPINIEFIEV